MRKKILILGTGGNALDVHDILAADWDILGFLDDAPQKKQFSYRDACVLGPLNCYKDYPDVSLCFAIGSSKNHSTRLNILSKLGLLEEKERFPPVIHHKAVISPTAHIGHGTIFLAGVSVGANAHIGDFTWCLQNSVISHDCRIGEGSLCACLATVSGAVSIGKGCYLGAGCVLREEIEIKEHSLIGMGAVVTTNITEAGTYMGCPAKRME